MVQTRTMPPVVSACPVLVVGARFEEGISIASTGVRFLCAPDHVEEKVDGPFRCSLLPSQPQIIKFKDFLVPDGGQLLIMEYLPLGNLVDQNQGGGLVQRELVQCLLSCRLCFSSMGDMSLPGIRYLCPCSRILFSHQDCRFRIVQALETMPAAGFPTCRGRNQRICSTVDFSADVPCPGESEPEAGYDASVDIWSLAATVVKYYEQNPM